MRECNLCGYTTLWRNCPKCISGRTREISQDVIKARKKAEYLKNKKEERERKARQKIAIASMLQRASEAAKCSK